MQSVNYLKGSTIYIKKNYILLITDHELEIEDLYPDYEEMEEESDKIPMFTVGEVITKLQVRKKVTMQVMLLLNYR